MEPSSLSTSRSTEPVVDFESGASRRDSNRTLTVTALFHLSEEGRKASLLDGGDGRAVQEVKVAVPTNRFHLVIEEVLEGMADEVFGVVGDKPRYVRDGVERLQCHLRQFPKYSDVVITRADLLVVSANAEQATDEQWAFKEELQALVPEGALALRMHRLSWRGDSTSPSLMQFGVLLTCKVGPFTLRREYLAPAVNRP